MVDLGRLTEHAGHLAMDEMHRVGDALTLVLGVQQAETGRERPHPSQPAGSTRSTTRGR